MKTKLKSRSKRQKHDRWHKGYNKEHNYATKETENRTFSKPEEYLIWFKSLMGGMTLTDIKIAKLLRRSLQSIQLKRCKMKKEGGFDFWPKGI